MMWRSIWVWNLHEYHQPPNLETNVAEFLQRYECDNPASKNDMLYFLIVCGTKYGKIDVCVETNYSELDIILKQS